MVPTGNVISGSANRVKYGGKQSKCPTKGLLLILDMGASSKSVPGASTTSAASAVQSSSTSGPGQQMLRNGMNPALRGYSPSKPYWKQGGPAPVTAGKT